MRDLCCPAAVNKAMQTFYEPEYLLLTDIGATRDGRDSIQNQRETSLSGLSFFPVLILLMLRQQQIFFCRQMFRKEMLRSGSVVPEEKRREYERSLQFQNSDPT